MTVFNGDNNQNTEQNQQKADKGNQSFVAELVKNRGEKWSDPEVIAKGKLEADAYIEELKAQLEELQNANKEGKKVDDLIAKIEKAAQSASATDGGASESNTKTSVSEEEIQSLVEKTLTEKEKKNTVKQNLEQVNSQLEESFGDEAATVVQKKAKELGMSMERLQEIAAESPSAFFTLIGEKPAEKRSFNQGSIRTEGVNMQPGNNKRNFAYYSDMRRKNPRQFHTAEIQNQMVQDRLKYGDAFYN